MKRYETTIEDGTLYVEDDGERLEIGALADVYELVGGETFDIEYDTRHAAYFEFVDADEDGVMTIDVRDAIERLSFPGTFVETLEERGLDSADGDAFPERTAYFADVMTDVWAKKGNLGEDENPFR